MSALMRAGGEGCCYGHMARRRRGSRDDAAVSRASAHHAAQRRVQHSLRGWRMIVTEAMVFGVEGG